MVGVIVILAAGGKDGLAAAWKRHNRFGGSLAVHDLHLLSRGSIHKLRVGSAPVLLDHPAEGVVCEIHGVNCKRLAACIPGIRVRVIVQDVAVVVVSRRRCGSMIGEEKNSRDRKGESREGEDGAARGKEGGLSLLRQDSEKATEIRGTKTGKSRDRSNKRRWPWGLWQN